MPDFKKYTLERLSEEATRLRDDLDYVLEILEGAIKTHPDTTVEVDSDTLTLDKDWPPCSGPPCKVESTTLEDAAVVVERRGNNVVELLRAFAEVDRGMTDVSFRPASIPEKVSDLEAITRS